MIELTLDVLRSRREADLLGSERAIRLRPRTYLLLRRMLKEINTGPVDVADYHRTATRLGDLLREISAGSDRTIFHYFTASIDPCINGSVRWFRLTCLDLQSHIQDLERWRAERAGLRVVK